MGSLGTSLLAWLLFPAAAYLLFVGIGLLAERASRVDLPNVLLAPVGMCGTVVLVMPLYWTGAGAWLATPVAVAASVAGFVLAGRAAVSRVNPGWLGLAGLGAYLMFMAPVVAAGGWTWTGYNFVNDTAVQFLLADHLGHNGMSDPLGPPAAPPQSTGLEHIRIYFETGYPLGIHGLLATLKPLGLAPIEAVYQPLIALLAALGALSLASLLRPLASVPVATAGGLMAVAGSLVYHYGLQGSVKEIGMLAALAAIAAVARGLLESRAGPRGWALLGVLMAAAVLIYSAAALPYLGVMAVVVAVAAFVQHKSAFTRRDLIKVAPVVALVAVLAALPALPKLVRFGDVAGDALGATQDAGVDLGHLLRPLELSQAAGVWLTEDYRVPVTGGNGTYNDLLIALVLALAVVGLVNVLRRRELGVLLYAVPAILALVFVAPRVSAYADAKLLALVTPGVVLIAWAGIAAIASFQRVAGLVLALAVSGAVIWSDALAYHGAQLAPVERLQALEDIGERYDGKGLMLVNDYEQFAKYFMRDARENVAAEAITPYRIRDTVTNFFVGLNVDVDQERQKSLAKFPWIVERKGADTSRPPANYRLEYENGFYTVWGRDEAVKVVSHKPFQRPFIGAEVPPCGDVIRFAAAAKRGEQIAAAFRPVGERLDTAGDARIPRWGPHPYIQQTLVTDGPGHVEGPILVDGGRYRIWVAGSFGRDIAVLLDGQEVGRVSGVNTEGEWLNGGVVRVPGGRHEIGLRRGGGSLAPGDGYLGFLGPLVFEPVYATDSVVWVEPRDAERRLCGRQLDWIAIVRR